MKKLFVIVALFLACTYQSVAQDLEKKISEWTTDLALSADQTAQIKTAFTERKTKIQTIRANPQGVDKAALKTTQQEFQAKMKTILSPEQYTKYEAKKKEGRKKLKQLRKERKKKGEIKADDFDDDDLD
jgi:hypothetical protein